MHFVFNIFACYSLFYCLRQASLRRRSTRRSLKELRGENEFPANFGRPFLGLLTNSSDSHIILGLSFFNCGKQFCLTQVIFVLKIFSLWRKVFDLWVTVFYLWGIGRPSCYVNKG
ncbi:hypothetical protein BpHYR1_020007 [Brachionus plicatilis]|uniref:Uncharacterized protein n=1 Tax=Brachionus plicatilis TaxID=10195 RepID=A0A3M7QHB1_BRAPC|nr:hypothetical protein BpHYR1_020007 [Brachionus plicatilis]